MNRGSELGGKSHARSVVCVAQSVVLEAVECLRADSIRLANAFRQLGVETGTRVATLVHKGPELVTTMLALWRLGAVYVPLFTAFARKAVDFRMRSADVRLVVTDTAQRSKLPELLGDEVTVVVVDGTVLPGDIDYREVLAGASDELFEPYAQGPDGALVHISSHSGRPARRRV